MQWTECCLVWEVYLVLHLPEQLLHHHPPTPPKRKEKNTTHSLIVYTQLYYQAICEGFLIVSFFVCFLVHISAYIAAIYDESLYQH